MSMYILTMLFWSCLFNFNIHSESTIPIFTPFNKNHTLLQNNEIRDKPKRCGSFSIELVSSCKIVALSNKPHEQELHSIIMVSTPTTTIYPIQI